MDRPFEQVVLVYNPNSTGGAEQVAHDLASRLGSLDDLVVEMTPTEYAGHARELAASAARRGGSLVVSVSGDGGYNEVVSGAMDAGDGVCSAAVVAVAAAGNANDHRRTTRTRPLGEAIAAGEVDRLDLLRLTVDCEAPRWAHSYIGLGITPTVALELEKGRKGSLREVLTTVREFARFHPFEVVLDDRTRTRFDSLVLATVSSMAKVADLAENGDPQDGRFEIVTIPHHSKLRTLRVAARAALRGLGPQPTVTRYAFRTTSPVPLQLDGEVLELDGDQHVVVEIVPGALRTVR